MRKLFLYSSILLASSNAVAQAPAPLFTLTGGSSFNASAFDFSGSNAMTRGAQVNLTAPALLTFTFLFREAGLTNTFEVNNQAVFNSAQSINTSYVTQVAQSSGSFNFGFLVPASASTPPRVTNATNATMTASGQASFGARVLSNTSVILFLDDIGTNAAYGTDDNDYDDMVVKIDAVSVAAIPESSTVAMMIGALGLFGLLRRHRRKV